MTEERRESFSISSEFSEGDRGWRLEGYRVEPAPRRWRVVFDGLNRQMKLSPFLSISRLTFELVLTADTEEQVITAINSIPGLENVGPWHVEEV